MTDSALDFHAYEVAVDALRKDFLGQVIKGEESPVEYRFSHQIDVTKNWRLPLLGLVEKLSDASFAVTLEVKIDDYDQGFAVIPGAEQPQVDFTVGDAQNPPALPPPATEAFDKFQQMVSASQTADANQSLESVLDVIADLSANAPSVQLWLSANLDKLAISENIDLTSAPAPQKVTYYLFAQNLASDLEQMSLANFEQDFCTPDQRSVIVVFDSPDLLAGDLLVICGRGHEDELRGWLTEPLSTETKQKTNIALRFRKSESFGDFQTGWLTPDFFVLRQEQAQTTPSVDQLRTQLESFRGLLSVLFLADYIERLNDGYLAEYRGIGVVKVKINRPRMTAKMGYADNLFQLYDYAYEGFSADKLEIVQQFISLITSDLDTLCRKAIELRDASKTTYATVLRNKVSVYFDAVNKIQERVKVVVDKSGESVISLSRDVSADVYKVVGIIAAAISVALLKPDFGWSVALAAAVILAVYMALVIFYHLQTLEAAYNLSMQQHAAYIRSFTGILGRGKVRKFLADEHLRNAKDLFRMKRSWAVIIYTWCLVLSSSVAAAIVGYKLLTVR